MNRAKANDLFQGHMQQLSDIDRKVRDITRKLQEIESMEDDSLIQMNMGICIFSVPKDQVKIVLESALDAEKKYQKILTDRFERAIGVLNGD